MENFNTILYFGYFGYHIEDFLRPKDYIENLIQISHEERDWKKKSNLDNFKLIKN